MAEGKVSKLPIDTTHLTWLSRTLDLYVVSEKINPEELIGKIESLDHLSYPEGEIIVDEGDRGRDLFVLYKGSAQVSRSGADIAGLAPGDMFGEIGFLVGVPRTATVRAGQDCEVFRCEAKGFEELLARHPNLLESMRTIAKLRMEKLNS